MESTLRCTLIVLTIAVTVFVVEHIVSEGRSDSIELLRQHTEIKQTECVPHLTSLLSAVASVSLTARNAVGVQCDLQWLPYWNQLFAAIPSAVRAEFALFVYVHGPASESSDVDAQLRNWSASSDGWFIYATTQSTRAAGRSSPCPGSRYPPSRNDTWTTGRNSLMSAMYAAEVARGRQFCRWAFADGDVGQLNCLGCPANLSSGALSACCFMQLFAMAQALPYAVVGNYGVEGGPYPFGGVEVSPGTVYFDPSLDAQFNVSQNSVIITAVLVP